MRRFIFWPCKICRYYMLVMVLWNVYLFKLHKTVITAPNSNVGVVYNVYMKAGPWPLLSVSLIFGCLPESSDGKWSVQVCRAKSATRLRTCDDRRAATKFSKPKVSDKFRRKCPYFGSARIPNTVYRYYRIVKEAFVQPPATHPSHFDTVVIFISLRMVAHKMN